MATKKITPKSMRELATNLMDYFNQQECWFDMGIYVDNERWSSHESKNTEKKITEKGTTYYVAKNINIKEDLEYSNPKTISMYFEGPLYQIINYDDYDYLYKLGEKFLKPYGLYFEQGYAWSAAAYED